MYLSFAQSTVHLQYLQIPIQITATSEPSNAGIGIPLCAINVQSPTVFSVTVLPPVFGPVMTIAVISFPNSIVLVTAVFYWNKRVSCFY